MASGHALLKSMPNFICSSSQSSWLLSRYSQERTQKVLQKFWNITTNAVILTNIIGQQIYLFLLGFRITKSEHNHTKPFSVNVLLVAAILLSFAAKAFIKI